MQAAEFKYLVVNTFEGWREGFGQAIRMYPEGAISLSPENRLTLSEAAGQSENGESIGQISGFSVDSEGNLFVIDAEQCRIFQYRVDGKELAQVQCIGGCGRFAGQFDFEFPPLNNFAGGLALDRASLYVADTDNHRIQAFHRLNYQLRFILGKEMASPEPAPGRGPGEFNLPKDLAVDSRGNFYVLDYGNRRIQKFTRSGDFLREFILITAEGHPSPLLQPLNLAVDQEDTLYVLYRGYRHVVKFNRGGERLPDVGDFSKILKILNKASEKEIKEFIPAGIAVDKDGLIYLGESDPSGARQLRIHVLDPNGRYLGNFGEYTHSCYQLLADKNGNLYANCGLNGDLIILKDIEGRYAARGTYYSKIFNSNERDTQWHRMVIDADIPPKSKIEISCRAANQEMDRTVPPDDPNISWSKILSSPHNALASRDGLLLNATGQYLQLKIELFGDEAHTPRLRQVLLYFPRLSYLRYLPATYQEDALGKDFLERFLSIFESFSFDMEQTIARLAKYFDPRAVNGEFLAWLGSWLAVSWDENWPEEKKRAFIERAYQLYKDRGTLQGLEAMVEFFTDKDAAILEHFLMRSPMVLGAEGHSRVGVSTVVGKILPKRLVLSENSRIGDFALEETEAPPEKPFQENAFDFTLLVDTSGLEGREQIAALERIIQSEKPAHTRCFIRTGRGSLRLGLHSLAGIDTILSKGFPPMRLGISSYLGKKTFLGTQHPLKGTLGVRSKISIDAILH